MENGTKITITRRLTHQFSSKLTILVLQNECGLESWGRTYAAIGRNLNMDTTIPRIRLHKSRSFFDRAIKNRQEKMTTKSFVN